ncbi:MAG: c-type cytochrome [Planctomycetaceae bacterium]|nr:c-type cytochrome [Planctomycetaceae bacterium]
MAADDPRLVAPTEALPAADQQKVFHLPQGFEIQLVAAEPAIRKPINMQFDATGALYVTESVEYPFPAPGGEPSRDVIKQFVDTDGDGIPETMSVAVDNLNIPIGLLPLGKRIIGYSIPEIQEFTDTDGDGKADSRKALYSEFGFRDTHGMASSFNYWIDGWVYACHGFANDSRVLGADGKEIQMNSGNTYRFRPDGSHIEYFTHGQVNPFGMAIDPLGNIFTADCHSRPIYQLLRGAYYPSFGKPHDGLGFAPNMIDHSHGSTGICGVAWYEATRYPPEYRDCIYLCNPVNGTVHRDQIEYRGSSPWVNTQPEFITCDDGWFRPVDVQLGPDGALYIADFYNAIIGHYEVPLEHPRRDRTHGRIWRVVHRGDQGDGDAVGTPPDLTSLALPELVAQLGSPNLTVRTLATNLLVDHPNWKNVVVETARQLDSALESMGQPHNERLAAHALWVLGRSKALTDAQVAVLSEQPSPLVRTQLVRAMTEGVVSPVPYSQQQDWLLNGHPQVQRAMAEFLARHISADSGNLVTQAMQQRASHFNADLHLWHTLKMAARNHLLQGQVTLNGADWCREIMLGTPTVHAAKTAWDIIHNEPTGARNLAILQHIARYGDAALVREVITHRQLLDNESVKQQRDALLALRAGIEQRGETPADYLAVWGTKLVRELWRQPVEALHWIETNSGPVGATAPTFVVQQRPAQGVEGESAFFCSLPNGEQRTGVLRSDAFASPASLSFCVAGHNAFPSQPLQGTNWVRLRDAASGAVLREVAPPRNDLAQQVVWDLAEYKGRQVFLEIVDGDTASAYAWLAVGRFSLPALDVGQRSNQQLGFELVTSLRLTDLSDDVRAMVASDDLPLSHTLPAARCWVALHPGSLRQVLLTLLSRPGLSDEESVQLRRAIISEEPSAARELIQLAIAQADRKQQEALAEQLVSDATGGELLLSLVTTGKGSPLLLTRADLTERLKSLPLEDAQGRIEQLTRDLPPLTEQIAQRLEQRRQAVLSAEVVDVAVGQAAFKKHCGVCHQHQGIGNKIGPQLDGVGKRGLDRLLEDIVDPNRNVDASFRTTSVALKSGQVLTGLKRQESDETLVLADSKGQENTIAIRDIEERRDTPLSLMPVNLVDQLTPEEFTALVRYLLAP